jgi:multicomponent Na+:H+ antiporter subunit F
MSLDATFAISTIWLGLLIFACAFLLVRGRTPGTRIVALDTVVLVLVGMLVVYSAAEEATFFLDAALMLALLGFVATIAAARYYGDGGPFR